MNGEEQINIPEGYERLIKGEKLGNLPKRTVSLHAQKRITFSKDLGKILSKYFGVETFINRDEKKIILIPSNDKVVASKLSRVPGKNEDNNFTGLHISSSAFKKENIKSGLYKIRHNLGIMEFKFDEKKEEDQ